jgi:hypothetical protein
MRPLLEKAREQGAVRPLQTIIAGHGKLKGAARLPRRSEK